MSLLALASAKGSPGVSTGALALASVWPSERRILVVEADSAGSALAPRFGLAYDRGVVSLAAASRHRFVASGVADHAQSLGLGAGRESIDVLVGVRGAEQGRVLTRFWEAFATAIVGETEPDVIVDCGRIGPDSPAMGVIAVAELTLLVVRPDTEGVVAAQLRAAALGDAGVEPERLGVVVVGSQPYGPAAVAEALDVPVVGLLAHDGRAASVLSGHRPARPLNTGRSALLRSARALFEEIDRRCLPAVPGPAWGAHPGALTIAATSEGDGHGG